MMPSLPRIACLQWIDCDHDDIESLAALFQAACAAAHDAQLACVKVWHHDNLPFEAVVRRLLAAVGPAATPGGAGAAEASGAAAAGAAPSVSDADVRAFCKVRVGAAPMACVLHPPPGTGMPGAASGGVAGADGATATWAIFAAQRGNWA